MEYKIEGMPPHVIKFKDGNIVVPNSSNGIKVTHLASGESVTCNEFRSQHKNKDKCIDVIQGIIDQKRDD